MKQIKNLEIEILPSGEIRFSRCDISTNKFLLEFLADFIDQENVECSKKFLDGSKNIEVLFGDGLCG